MGTTEREDVRETWHLVRDTQRIERRVRRERFEVDGMSRFEGGRQKRVRQDGDEVLCAERAAVSARVG